MANVLSDKELALTDAYGRAANYLSAGQIYLYDKLDRFHLVGDVIDRVPKLGARAACAKQAIRDELIEHKEYIARLGEDMPEITGWPWGQTRARVEASSMEADNV